MRKLLIPVLWLLTGCGGVPHSTTAVFPFPAQTLTCKGSATAMLCDESDGKTFYNHYTVFVSLGTGTFRIVQETGMLGTGLRQLNVHFPQELDVTYLRATETITAFCGKGEMNGIESDWDGNAADGSGTVFLLGSKFTYMQKSNLAEEYSLPPQEETAAPPVRLQGMQNNTFLDLCSDLTLHWTIDGRFLQPKENSNAL